MYDLNSWLRAAIVAELAQKLVLGYAVRQVERLAEPDARRNRLVDQRVQRRRADDLQHRAGVGVVRTDVAGLERCSALDAR